MPKLQCKYMKNNRKNAIRNGRITHCRLSWLQGLALAPELLHEGANLPGTMHVPFPRDFRCLPLCIIHKHHFLAIWFLARREIGSADVIVPGKRRHRLNGVWQEEDWIKNRWTWILWPRSCRKSGFIKGQGDSRPPYKTIMAVQSQSGGYQFRV